MLRISFINTEPGDVCMQLQGRLVGPWVDEFQAAVSASQHPLQLLQLDLASLQFVDAQGIALLQQLQDEGAQVVAVSPFVQELLLKRCR